MTREIKIGNVTLGGDRPLVLFAGPCVIEDETLTLRIATFLKEMSAELGIGLVFKGSYDKANRTSVTAFRGPGIDEGLRILAKVKSELDLPVVSDVHDVSQVAQAAEVLDVIQIPAFLCRQTDLLVAVGNTGKVVNVKKGQFLAPGDMKNAVGKIESTGNSQIALTERGSTFGYNNLVVDMRSLAIMRETGCPVIFDATHSVQLPGGEGGSSGGQREFVGALSRAATAIGIDGLFLEVHEDPSVALCDGPNSIYLSELKQMLEKILAIDRVVKGPEPMADFLEKAKDVLRTEANAVLALVDRIDGDFCKAVEMIMGCKGRVVITGMGKSGLICQKIAATMASTGTPAMFLHPAEGVHGDLGMLMKDDVIIAVSNSGETDEIIRILPVIKRMGMPLISMSGNPASTLARAGDVSIDISVAEEACPLALAPTSSTTATLAMGDALAVSLMIERGFKEDDFALYHPGGALGRRLLTRVEDLMHTGEALPMVAQSVSVKDALFEITSKKLGITGVSNEGGELIGVFTDGDLRRAIEKDINCLHQLIKTHMSVNPKRILRTNLAAKALHRMEENSITSLFVFESDVDNQPVAIIHLQDLLKAGVV